MNSELYDGIIIGFGKGGKTLASDLSLLGKKIILIEQNEEMFGGTCINEGCIPSKFLYEKAKKISYLNKDREFLEKYYEEVINEKTEIVKKLREKNYLKVKNNNVEIIIGRAKLISKNVVEVTTKNEVKKIEGKNIFINTGASSIVPDIDGIKDNPSVYTSRELLNLKKLPKHFVILGGGYIGIEFASMYKDFGSEVTLLIRENDFMPREDTDISEAIKNNLEKKGINILMNTVIKKVSNENDTLEIIISKDNIEEKIISDGLLLATGRKPNTNNFGLENVGIKTNDRGGIITDMNRLTNISNIYAMGDVLGKEQFTYLSLDDYKIVKSHLLNYGKYTEENRGVIPYTIFINPPFSRVGMTEKEALEKGYEIKVAKVATSTIPKAIITGTTEGFIKIIIDKNTKIILGAHLFCEQSQEIINLLKLSIEQELSYEVLRDMVYTHPTITEILNELLSKV